MSEKNINVSNSICGIGLASPVVQGIYARKRVRIHTSLVMVTNGRYSKIESAKFIGEMCDIGRGEKPRWGVFVKGGEGGRLIEAGVPC